MTASEKIKTLRTKAGFTQKELAEKLGVAQSRIGRWESGKVEPLYKTVMRIEEICKSATK
jgi:transcriptional regulator with XRE-family HTH domain